MIHARDFVEPALARGFDWYAGVPCSFLTPFINYVIEHQALNYVSAANEGDAVAIAAGAAIGGKRSVAMMQNSGLGNAISPLTSLTYTFRIPLLVICTHRGAAGVSDEPQHELMGKITERMFDTVSVPWMRFPQQGDAIGPALDAAHTHFENASSPFAMIMQKGTCEPYALTTQPQSPTRISATVERGIRYAASQRASRHEVLRTLVDQLDPTRDVVIASTGFTGRELYAVGDQPNQLYMVGSMGCASSLGLGLALARPDLRVVVVDGDGAALMRMGNLATIGAYRPDNLIHVLLDNEVHDSTGGQATVSGCTDFAGIAAACGYGAVKASDSLEDIPNLGADHASGGPTFVHCKIRPGAIDNLPRPAITPPEVLDRLRRHIGAI